ncbi:MAG: helix-turn-helix domain-containing protein [Patescibacteria group bacterium]
MKKDLEIKTKKLRIQGYSIKELHKIIGVSKSTISRWIQNVPLSDKAMHRIQQNYTNGQLASQKTIKEKTRQKNLEADNFAINIINKVNLTSEISLSLCALIYQCEGSKNIKESITFTNSDPVLIKTFLYLFRNSFTINENKLKVLMHLHDYHNEEEQKEFWFKVTKIPKNQFYRSYLKKTDHKYKKEGYQGCVQIRYNDVVIGRKINSVAKLFMERYK